MPDLEIFAILTKSQYQKVITGQCEIEVPSGVELSNKAGSRSLYFSCENKEAAKELTEGLDDSGISWQEVFGIDEVE